MGADTEVVQGLKRQRSNGVREKNGYVQVDLRFCGRGRITTTDRWSEANRKEWVKKRMTMERMNAEGLLDAVAFAKFFPLREVAQRNSISYAQVADEWEAWLPTKRTKKGKLAASTIHFYKTYNRVCWREAFEGKAIDAITDRMVEAAVEQRLSGFENKTHNNYVSVLKQVFDFAVAKGYIAKSPAEKIQFVAGSIRLDPGKVYQHDEIEPLLAAIRKVGTEMYGDELGGECYANYFEFCFFTGMRPAEVIALERADCDIPQGRLFVKRARVMAQDTGGKTGSRTVNLNPRALEVLQRQLKLGLSQGVEHRRVFFRPDGEAFHDQQMPHRVWVRAHQLVEMRYREPYATRHTSVSMNLIMGRRERWVAMQHGHSVQVMEQVYAHWVADPNDDGDSTSPLVQKIRALYRLADRKEAALRVA